MIKIVINILFCLTSLLAQADPLGEEARYILDNDRNRTSLLISGGEGTATVVESRDDPKIGPAYVVSIDYSFDAMFVGHRQGNLGLLVPEAMFEQDFYDDLKNIHPVNVGSFDVDYLGMSRATDSDNNTYDQCMMIKFFNVDPNFRPIPQKVGVHVLWHLTEDDPIQNIVLKFKRHATVPVLGAVQIDLSGKVHGFNIKAGLDYIP